MTVLGLAEPFKTINRLDPAWSGPIVAVFNDLFLGEHKKIEIAIQILTQSSFKSSTKAIKI